MHSPQWGKVRYGFVEAAEDAAEGQPDHVHCRKARGGLPGIVYSPQWGRVRYGFIGAAEDAAGYENIEILQDCTKMAGGVS